MYTASRLLFAVGLVVLSTAAFGQDQDAELNRLRKQAESADHDDLLAAAKRLRSHLMRNGELQDEVLTLLEELANYEYSTLVVEEASLSISSLSEQDVSVDQLTHNLNLLLQSKNTRLRVAAMLAYPLREFKEFLAAADHSLRDEKPQVRLAAISKLRQVGLWQTTVLLDRHPSNTRSKSLGVKLAGMVSPLLSDKDPDVRRAAIESHALFLLRAHTESLTLKRGLVDDTMDPDAPSVVDRELKFGAVHIKDDTRDRYPLLTAAATDGKVLAVGYDVRRWGDGDRTHEGRVDFYDLRTGRRLGSAGGGLGPVQKLAFGKDGVLYAQMDKVVRIENSGK